MTPWPAALQTPLAWNFPSKNTGVGCNFLFQGIFSTQGSNPHLLYWQVDSIPHVPPGKPHLIFTYLQIFQFFCVWLISSFIPLQSEKMLDRISIFLDLIKICFVVELTGEWSLYTWKEYVILLLWDRMSHKYLNPSGLICGLIPRFPYWFSIWIFYSLMEVGY